MADGSIVLKAELDDKQAQIELNRLTKKIDTLNDKITSKKQEQMPLVEQSKQIAVNLDNAKAKLFQMKSGNEFVTSSALREQEQTVASIQKDFNSVQKRVENIGTSIANDTQKLDRMKTNAGELSAQLAGAKSNAQGLSPAAQAAANQMEKLASRIKGLARRVFVFTIITQALRAMRNWISKSIRVNSEATQSIAQLKGALLTLAQPLLSVVVPAFITLVNILTSVVNTISKLISMLFGTTIEESAKAAENLYDEQKALDGVGASAKKAGKSLANFDEINKLTLSTTNGGAGGSSIAPDFSNLKKGILSTLTFTLDDILFNWEDLTAEDILSKIIVLLSALCGGIIGWVLGGPGGAVLGMLIGAGIGLLISNLTFDGDGVLSPEEILKSVILALGALAGGILGFVIGGPSGAALGVLIGAGVALAVNGLIFNGDGILSQEEILTSAITALGALAGGIIGFIIGGPGGAAIGAIIGTGLTLSILKMLFNGDGELSQEEILNSVATVLSAMLGGIIGFAVGGPGGAAIGAVIGAGITAKILSLGFEKTGISAEKIIVGLVEALVSIAGGLIGFAVGGPAGAVVGASVGVGLSLIIDRAFFKNKSGKKAGYEEGRDLGDNVNQGAKDSLGIHSPSTEFQQMGDYMMQGMANGITGSQYLVLSVFQTLLDSIQLSFDTWQTNFFTGFAAFRSTFRELWTNFWSLMGRTFTIKWNNILSTLQQGVNNAIDALNSLVDAANSLAELTGRFYSHVGHINVPKISLPKLATGAVIPPNREFLAVLGDQKQGTNIEAPAELIRQMVIEGLRSAGGQGQVIENVLMLDGEVIYQNQKEIARQHGVNLAEV